MSLPLIPFDRWQSGTNENSLPANDNSLRSEILSSSAVSASVTAQPSLSSPADDGKWYVIPSGATGSQWATFAEDSCAIFYGGTWYEFTPVDGVIVTIDAELYYYDSGWVAMMGGGGDSTLGKQAIFIAAASMRPSASGGCSQLTTVTTSANQPDILSLDFDPSTDEFAQFSFVMPKKWNEGTITARFHWAHAATTTNFAVIWGLQAVSVGNDDTIGVAYGTAQTVTDTGGTTNDLYTSDETSAITVGGLPGSEEMVYCRVYRDADAGGDTLAIDARLLGVTVYVTTDAGTDA